MLSNAQSAAAAESNAVVTVVTSRCTPDSAWRPTDAEVLEVPAAAFDPAAWATNENGPVGLGARLAHLIREAESLKDELGLGRVSLDLSFTDDVVAAVLANGGEVVRAFCSTGWYLAARIDRPRVKVNAVGPDLFGPLTEREIKDRVEHAASMGYRLISSSEVAS